MYLIRRQIYIIISITEQLPIIFIMEKSKIKEKRRVSFQLYQKFIRLVVNLRFWMQRKPNLILNKKRSSGNPFGAVSSSVGE